ncbi:BglG family transcription antiterminator [Lactobacillus gasseri]|uniref:BglG family transcription antiterminator n=1 Tax=Lactobacillus gasseri TaxID=1596 RepID=UPI0001A57BFD|nr:PTS sugar transporter subunit IIA [Lactobacillus gasseri]EEQ26016.1 PRD domain protein [Lactobacillus gasseri 202-4]
MQNNEDILLILQKNSSSWITAKMLSVQLGITERTVKNKIKKLRAQGVSIKSSVNGYQYRGENTNQKKLLLPQTYSQRKSWLLRYLLQTKDDVNIYDLSQKLYINEVELRKEIQNLETELSDFDLTLSKMGDNYKVLGSEQNKRKLLSALIYQELKGTLLTKKVIQDNFKLIKVDAVNQMLVLLLEKYELKIDDFDFNNLLLHIVIMIDRGSNNLKSVYSNLKIVNQIVKWIKSNENIDLSSNDVHQLEEMFLLLSDKGVELKKDDDKIQELFQEIVGFVRRTYNLNLNERLFKKRFLPHLIRLIERCKNNATIHNPLMNNIKQSSPTIYECACLIAYAIHKSYGIEISEEEIAFIALHVGNSVAEQIQNENKIICQMYMSNYHDNVQRLLNQINARFSNDLILLDAVSDVNDIMSQTQLVIVVDSEQQFVNFNTTYISSFFLSNDVTKLQRAIREMKLEIRAKRLKIGLKVFTTPDTFYIDNKKKNYKQVISELSNKMVREGIVGPEFECKLLERENISSTAFGLVAIPHAIDYDAKSSKWFIYINPKGVDWLNQRIYLVFVLAYNSRNDDEFRKVFDELSTIVIDDEKVVKLINSRSYDDFIERITKV